MPIIRVWISHWFSTAYHFVQAIRHNSDQQAFYILGSNEKPHSVVLSACDASFVEPPVQGAAYVEYALEVCRRERIRVFIPSYKKLQVIAEHVAEFEALGVRALVSRDPQVLAMLQDKPQAYAFAQAQQWIAVPEYYVVSTPAQFRQAYQTLIGKGLQVCVKPRGGQGGVGFRILDESYNQLKTLYYPPGARMSFAQICRLLDTQTQFSDLLVSEYLDGAEYSIDCLSDSEGHLRAAVPRRKLDERRRLLEDNAQLLDIVQGAAKLYRLPYVFNVQLRYRDGVPKLLEINPRMSGGLYISCLSGVNFPYLAVQLLLGNPVAPLTPRLNQIISEVEGALCWQGATVSSNY